MRAKVAKAIRRQAKEAGLTSDVEYENIAPRGLPAQIVAVECQKALEKQIKRELRESK